MKKLFKWLGSALAICVVLIAGFVVHRVSEQKALESAALAGDLALQIQLFAKYFYAQPPDFGKAAKWGQLAQGNGAYRLASFMPFVEAANSLSQGARGYDAIATSLEQADPTALFVMGMALTYGVGIPTDAGQGLDYWKSAAIAGHAQAQFHLAVQTEKMAKASNNVALAKEAVNWANKSAQQSHALAQTLVGGYSLAGFHVDQDATEALRWFQLAASQGAAVGELGLGRLYLIGLDDFPPDPGKAVGPLQAAYKAGVEIAAYDLGIMFRDGNGVIKDLNKAREYLQFAADKGIQGAQKDLANIAPALQRYKAQ